MIQYRVQSNRQKGSSIQLLAAFSLLCLSQNNYGSALQSKSTQVSGMRTYSHNQQTTGIGISSSMMESEMNKMASNVENMVQQNSNINFQLANKIDVQQTHSHKKKRKHKHKHHKKHRSHKSNALAQQKSKRTIQTEQEATQQTIDQVKQELQNSYSDANDNAESNESEQKQQELDQNNEEEKDLNDPDYSHQKDQQEVNDDGEKTEDSPGSNYAARIIKAQQQNAQKQEFEDKMEQEAQNRLHQIITGQGSPLSSLGSSISGKPYQKAEPTAPMHSIVQQKSNSFTPFKSSSQTANIIAQAILHQQQKQPGQEQQTEDSSPASSALDPPQQMEETPAVAAEQQTQNNEPDSIYKVPIVTKDELIKGNEITLNQNDQVAKDFAVQQTLNKIKGVHNPKAAQDSAYSSYISKSISNSPLPTPFISGPSLQAAPVQYNPIKKVQQSGINVINSKKMNQKQETNKLNENETKNQEQNEQNIAVQKTLEAINKTHQESIRAKTLPAPFLDIDDNQMQAPVQQMKAVKNKVEDSLKSKTIVKNVINAGKLNLQSKYKQDDDEVGGYKIAVEKLDIDESQIKHDKAGGNSHDKLEQLIEEQRKKRLSQNIAAVNIMKQNKDDKLPLYSIETSGLVTDDDNKPTQLHNQLINKTQIQSPQVVSDDVGTTQQIKKDDQVSYKIETTVATPDMFKQLVAGNNEQDDVQPKFGQKGTKQSTNEIIKNAIAKQKQKKLEPTTNSASIDQEQQTFQNDIAKPTINTASQTPFINQQSTDNEVDSGDKIVDNKQQNVQKMFSVASNKNDKTKVQSQSNRDNQRSEQSIHRTKDAAPNQQNIRQKIQNIVQSIQPALQQAIGDSQTAKIQVIVTDKNQTEQSNAQTSNELQQNTQSSSEISSIQRASQLKQILNNGNGVNNITIKAQSQSDLQNIVQTLKMVAPKDQKRKVNVTVVLDPENQQNNIVSQTSKFIDSQNKLNAQSSLMKQKKDAEDNQEKLIKIMNQLEQKYIEKQRKEQQVRQQAIQNTINAAQEKKQKEQKQREEEEKKQSQQMNAQSILNKQKKDDIVQKQIQLGLQQKAQNKSIQSSSDKQDSIKEASVNTFYQKPILKTQKQDAKQSELSNFASSLEDSMTDIPSMINQSPEGSFSSSVIQNAIEKGKERDQRKLHPLSGGLFDDLQNFHSMVDTQKPVQLSVLKPIEQKVQKPVELNKSNSQGSFNLFQKKNQLQSSIHSETKILQQTNRTLKGFSNITIDQQIKVNATSVKLAKVEEKVNNTLKTSVKVNSTMQTKQQAMTKQELNEQKIKSLKVKNETQMKLNKTNQTNTTQNKQLIIKKASNSTQIAKVNKQSMTQSQKSKNNDQNQKIKENQDNTNKVHEFDKSKTEQIQNEQEQTDLVKSNQKLKEENSQLQKSNQDFKIKDHQNKIDQSKQLEDQKKKQEDQKKQLEDEKKQLENEKKKQENEKKKQEDEKKKQQDEKKKQEDEKKKYEDEKKKQQDEKKQKDNQEEQQKQKATQQEQKNKKEEEKTTKQNNEKQNTQTDQKKQEETLKKVVDESKKIVEKQDDKVKAVKQFETKHSAESGESLEKNNSQKSIQNKDISKEQKKDKDQNDSLFNDVIKELDKQRNIQDIIKNQYLNKANHDDSKPQPQIQYTQKHKSNKKTINELKSQNEKMKQITREESSMKQKSLSDKLDKVIQEANKNYNRLERKAPQNMTQSMIHSQHVQNETNKANQIINSINMNKSSNKLVTKKNVNNSDISIENDIHMDENKEVRDENTPIYHILTEHNQEINIDSPSSDLITIIPTSTTPISKDQSKQSLSVVQSTQKKIKKQQLKSHIEIQIQNQLSTKLNGESKGNSINQFQATTKSTQSLMQDDLKKLDEETKTSQSIQSHVDIKKQPSKIENLVKPVIKSQEATKLEKKREVQKESDVKKIDQNEEDNWFMSSIKKFKQFKTKMFSALSFLPQTGSQSEMLSDEQITNQQKLHIFDAIIDQEDEDN